MNTSSLSYLQSTLANQLTSNSLNSSSSQTSKNKQPSVFAQMLSDATANSSAAGSTATTGNAAQLLNQLVSNFQVSGIQNQGQSLDPTAISA
jgi:hypothetical protein